MLRPTSLLVSLALLIDRLPWPPEPAKRLTMTLLTSITTITSTTTQLVATTEERERTAVRW